MKKPFFARFLETQTEEKVEEKAEGDAAKANAVKTGLRVGAITRKYPSDRDEFQTMKYPSDDDEGSVPL